MMLKTEPRKPPAQPKPLTYVASIIRDTAYVRPVDPMVGLSLVGAYTISSAHQQTRKSDVMVELDGVVGRKYPFYKAKDRRYLFEVIGEERTHPSEGYEKPDS